MEFTNYLLTPLLAFILSIIFIPISRRIAFKIKLVDKPNARKVHTDAVPLVGGIVVFVATALSLLMMNKEWLDISVIKVISIGAGVLLAVGAIDDKLDIRAILKLLIQLALAHFAFINGIAIESMYGILGIEELPYWVQYILTITIITGVINAFNLMDGIDGLAAGLAIIGLAIFTYLAFLVGNSFLCLLFLAIIGALVGFLRFNLSKTQKIFMGDAGSLFLGFILIISAISIIQAAESLPQFNLILALIIGVLALPVIDSLRVYRGRIKKGGSPFKADKTHLHHLVLFFGMSHKASTAFILGVCGLIIVASTIVGHFFGIGYAILALLLLFMFIVSFLSLNKDVKIWRDKIKHIEE